MLRRRVLATATAAAALAVTAACGQKSGVHDPRALRLPPIIVQNNGVAAGAPSEVTTQSEGTTSGGTTGGTSSGGPAPTPKATTPSGSGTAGAAKLSRTGHDRTGVSDTTLTLSVHAPVTGAAPLPATAFEKARDLYWRYVTEIKKEKVLGRAKVEVLFRDDKYTPNTAIQACRELAAQAFLIVGGGGTDQIQACGGFANQAKVPYLSAGVTEKGLRGLQWYFATSMSYKQQGPLLAQYVKKKFPNAKVGMIATDTPNFDDAVQGWESAVKTQGLNYYKTLRHPKGNNSWISSFSRDMQDAGVSVLYMLTAPTDYIQFAQQAGGQNYRPQYVGAGITMGLNAVLGAGCPDVDKGIFFSPFPGLDWARQNEPAFFEAGQKLGVPVDDIALALWGLAKTQHEAFRRYEQTFASTDLTREDFIAMLARQQGIRSNVFPELSYTSSDHFGAGQVHVLQADCGAKEHKTLAAFASGF